MKWSRAAVCTGLVGLVLTPVLTGVADPCPKARSLESQIQQANAIVLGHVDRAADCPPPIIDPVEKIGTVICHGREATVTIQKVWKGFPKKGHVLRLSMLPDRPRIDVEAGQTVALFVKLFATGAETVWYGESNACMYPEGALPTDRQLVRQLDQQFAKQPK